MKDKNTLKYEDLMLGEQAREAFYNGESPREIEGKYPIYLNTTPVIAGLNVTDLAVAGVLAGLNALYVGGPGTGKSQLAQDVSNYYFGRDMREGGNALVMEGIPGFDMWSEVLARPVKKEVIGEDGTVKEVAGPELTGNHEALFWDLEEINRCPEITQNQFFALGNGRIIHKGYTLPVGREGYVSSVATANLGNGDYQGTFGMDKALFDRFALVFDFDYDGLKPTREDRMLINMMVSANPKVKEAPVRDISDKIMAVEREIAEAALEPGLEARSVLNFLRFGLENCQNEEYGAKTKTWPRQCQDCSLNEDEDLLCSLVREPSTRTVQGMIKYAAALDWLAKLKNPGQEVDPVDIMFKSFELTAAYHNVLNPMNLRMDHDDQNPEMMANVAQKLKEDFKRNESVIVDSLQRASEGEAYDDYFMYEGRPQRGYSELSDLTKEDVEKLEPFNDDREVGLSWVKSEADIIEKVNSARKSRQKRGSSTKS